MRAVQCSNIGEPLSLSQNFFIPTTVRPTGLGRLRKVWEGLGRFGKVEEGAGRFKKVCEGLGRFKKAFDLPFNVLLIAL